MTLSASALSIMVTLIPPPPVFLALVFLALSLLVTDSVDVAKPSDHFLAFSYLTFEKHLAGNFSSPGFSINWTLWFAVRLPPSFSFY